LEAYELDTKVLRFDLPRLLGEVDGGRFTPLAYAMSEMRLRAVILGYGRNSLESNRRTKELSKMPELSAEILASIL
jgi:hypothetical protein